MAKESDKPAPGGTLSDVLGDELAAKLGSASDPGLPGPAPWEVSDSVPATPTPTPAPAAEMTDRSPKAHPQAAEVHQPHQPPEVHQPPELHQTPEVHPQVPETHQAPEHQPEGAPDLIDRRGTDEILAEVMPLRRFGKLQADRAANEHWPRIRRIPKEVLLPLWRRVRAWVDAVGVRIRAWPRRTKIAVSTAVLGVAAIILVVGLTPSNRQYVQEPAWLSAGPSLEAGDFPRVGVLQAREAVDIMQEVGPLALVVDSVGRVGYVDRQALGDAPPTANPDQPYTRCGRLPGETENRGCESRAEKQRTECLQTCEEVVDVAACTGNCESRSNDCVAGCASAIVPVLPAGTEPETTAEAPVGEPDEEPATAADETRDVATTTESVETTENVKPKKKKPPRKKRRRSRKKR